MVAHPISASNFSDPATRNRLEAAIAATCDSRWFHDIRHCVPQLASLLEQDAGRDRDQLTSAVRRIVFDHCQMDEGGDAMSHDESALEHQVEIVVEEMTRLRQRGLQRGRWSETPIPPLMHG